MDQTEFHNAVISKDPEDRINALKELNNYFKNFPDKGMAEEELLRLAKDENSEIRSWTAETLGLLFSDLPNKYQVWENLLQLSTDKDADVRYSASHAVVSIFPELSDKSKAEYDLLEISRDESAEIRLESAWIIGKIFSNLLDKHQAWEVLLRLVNDESEFVRDEAVRSIGEAFIYVHDKVLAENDLLQLTKNDNAAVRKSAAWAIGKVFDVLPNKSQAEFDFLTLAKDEVYDVRSLVADIIFDLFSDFPDKSQAENDLLLLAKDESPEVRNSAALAIGANFRYLQNKIKAEEELDQLAKDIDSEAREGAARSIGFAFEELLDKSKAELNLNNLSIDENANVRNSTARTIGLVFKNLANKSQAAKDLLQLATDNDSNVRTEAIRSIGLSFNELDNDNDFKIQSLNDLQRYRIDSNAMVREASETAIKLLGSNVVSNQSNATKNLEIYETSNKIPPLDIPSYAVPDNTGGEDLLGFKVYAQALADFIRNENTEKPITIGIDAAWGTGKTFLMEMICKELVGEEKCRQSRGLVGIKANARHKNKAKENKSDQTKRLMAVWFNAWKYDKEGALWAALTLEILRQLRKQSGVKDWMKLIINVNLSRMEWESLCEKFFRIAILSLPVIILSIIVLIFNFFITKYDFTGFLQKSFQIYGLAWLLASAATFVVTFKYLYNSLIGPFDLKISQYLREPNYSERIGFLAQFEKDFSRVISSISKDGQKTLVIFIDDLDRCSPPKPVEIIEAINTLIDANDCVFVIGMDSRAVASSIEAKYKDLRDYLDKTGDSSGASLGQQFLDKIIQINFRIPTAESISISNLIKHHMIPEIDGSDEYLRQTKSLESIKGKNEIYIAKKQVQDKHDVSDASEIETGGAKIAHKKEKISEYSGEVDQSKLEQGGKKQEQKILEFAQKFDNFAEVLDAIERAQPFLRSNPRLIKKFLNYFRLLALIANRKNLLETKIIHLDLLAKWTVIQIRWPDIIDTLEKDGCFIGRLNRAHELASQIQESSSELKNSIHNEQDVSKLRITEIITSDRRDLNQLISDPKIKRMIEEHDFMTLLSEFKGTLFNYVYLAQVV